MLLAAVNAIPIAKMLTPGGPEPWAMVTPLDVEWWEQMTPLENASREGRLRCPRCGGQLVYCCGETMAPYFRHPRNSCLAGEAKGGPGGGRGRVNLTWVRYQFARLLLEVLPGGRIDGARAFDGDGALLVTLADGHQVLFDVQVTPDAYGTLDERRARHQAEGVPVYYIFAGELLYRQVTNAELLTSTRLDPLMVAAIEDDEKRRHTSWVDVAYTGYTFTQFKRRPQVGVRRSVLCFEPGKNGREDLGTLLAVRALVPDPEHPNVWAGSVVRAKVIHGRPHGLRFSRWRGFYWEKDLAVLQEYRENRHRLRIDARARRAAAAAVQTPPAVPADPSPGRSGTDYGAPGWYRRPDPVLPDGVLNLVRTHRIERAGARTFFIPHSLGQCYVHPGGDLVIIWNGRRFDGCGETTMGVADREVQAYQRQRNWLK